MEPSFHPSPLKDFVGAQAAVLRRTVGVVSIVAGLAAPSLLASPAVDAGQDQSLEFFEKKVRPILVNHCYTCHSAETKPAGGLRVDDRNGLIMGGDEGPAVVPGNPDKSLLLTRVQRNHAKVMPKEGELLTDTQIADLSKWIKDGATWPRERIPASIGRTSAEYDKLKAEHWAWQPLKPPTVPAVKDTGWARDTIDQFILAKLEEKQLSPVADADKVTLIRRVTYDLTGLPPKPEDVYAFLKDTSDNAFAKVVDRLLQSQQFAEQWGRHWLDVARYGESTGPSRNIPYPHAWKYRDYVLDAVNRDIPYDQFIREQIAGDLLPAASSAERDRLLTATGFLALGVKDVNQRFKVRFTMDNVDEQIDAVTRSVLGLTVSCARCHDHKFDPIPVTDYYALAGIFTSTDHCAGVRNKMGGGGLDYYDPAMLVKLASDAPPVPEGDVEKLKAQVAEAKEAWDKIRGTPEGLARGANGQPKQRAFRLKFDRLQGDLLALTDPAARGHAVHGVRDATTVADTEVRIRGEAERLGPTVPRGFLSAFQVPGTEPVNPQQSGRLELAKWLTSANNPLTGRVIVNRVWQSLFGTGIVNTVDNFGINGGQPSHPELLDYLTQEFVREGWSLKKLVRRVVLTRSYQLGVEAPDANREVDPANRLVWRHSPRRLTAEEIRDTLLVTSGQIQPKPEASAAKELRMVEMRDNGAEAASIHRAADKSLSRSVYLPLLRGVTPGNLQAFDPVEQTLVTGQRDATTVPTQALYLLNSPFVRKEALALASKAAGDTAMAPGDWVRQIYLLTLGRSPSDVEAARAEQFLAEYASTYQTELGDAPVLAQADVRESSDTSTTDETAAKPPVVPENPDNVDRSDQVVVDEAVVAPDAKTAAWLNLVQALYASAEFRFVR